MTTPSNTLPEHWDQVGVLAYIYDRIAAETDDMDDCWWWCAGLDSDNSNPHPTCRPEIGGPAWSVRRLLWLLHGNELPPKVRLLPCDERIGCVNPTHQRLSTTKAYGTFRGHDRHPAQPTPSPPLEEEDSP